MLCLSSVEEVKCDFERVSYEYGKVSMGFVYQGMPGEFLEPAHSELFLCFFTVFLQIACTSSEKASKAGCSSLNTLRKARERCLPRLPL